MSGKSTKPKIKKKPKGTNSKWRKTRQHLKRDMFR